MSANTSKITRDDIKSKLSEIQGEASDTVEGAKNQIIAVVATVGVVIVIGIYLLGRRGGAKRTTIIELKRN